MDLKDQLKELFPKHQEMKDKHLALQSKLFIQEKYLICKYEKRNGKAITIIEGYEGTESDFKILTSKLKKKFSVGGSYKKDTIIIQGNYRDQIMNFLQDMEFNVKRVGG